MWPDCAQSLSTRRPGVLAPAVLFQAGLHVIALLRAERDEDRVCAAAAGSGIATTGLRRHFDGRPGRPGVVMGFDAIDTGELPADLTAPRGALVG